MFKKSDLGEYYYKLDSINRMVRISDSGMYLVILVGYFQNFHRDFFVFLSFEISNFFSFIMFVGLSF